VDIVLVDSGSTDATVAIARRYPVRVVSIEPKDFTFGRSLNLGIRHAQGRFVVLASAHVYPVYPDWIERLLAPLQDGRVALTYGRQRGNSATRFSEQQIFAKLYPAASAMPQSHAFCNNANAAIRRELWLQRPYDEDLSGLEDLEWATWARGRGLGIAYVAEAEVVHVHDETPRHVYNRYRREAIALKRLRPYEHFGLADCLRLYLSNVLSDAWHSLRQGRGPLPWPEIAWYRWMQFWGTYRGFGHRGPLTSELKRTFYYPRRLSEQASEPARAVDPIDYPVTTGEG
jgi:glycosyltransferase involved in cell wall biosynthesis